MAPRPKPIPKAATPKKQIDELPPYDGLAAQFLVAVLRQADGTEDCELSVAKLRKSLGDVSRDDINELILDLKDDELLQTGVASDGGAFVQPVYELYKRYDQTVMEYDTVEDAKKCAKLLLKNDSYWMVANLHQRLRWPERRLNPALQYLFPMFKPGLVSSGTGTNYSAYSMSLTDNEFDALEQFIAS